MSREIASERDVRVTRQYSGTPSRIDGCEVAPSTHRASDESRGCIGVRPNLREESASDIGHLRQASATDGSVFRRSWEIAPDPLVEALESGGPPRVVLADSGNGDTADFRDGLEERQFPWSRRERCRSLPDSDPSPRT